MHGPGSTTLAIGILRSPSSSNHSEFYMNCAPVVVVGKSGSSFTGPRIFEANIFGQGTCNTVEGVDVAYPNPGKSVHFGGAFVGGNTGPATTLANCPFDQNVDLTTTGSGASASAGNGASNGILPSTTFSDIRFLWFFSFICRCCSHCWCRRRTDSRPTSNNHPRHGNETRRHTCRSITSPRLKRQCRQWHHWRHVFTRRLNHLCCRWASLVHVRSRSSRQHGLRCRRNKVRQRQNHAEALTSSSLTSTKWSSVGSWDVVLDRVKRADFSSYFISFFSCMNRGYIFYPLGI